MYRRIFKVIRIMKNFDGITFKWTFRDYQQRVLDNSKRFIEDGKVNIVAAPGSGKTILGLEIIKRLGKPCLIFSPTTTIRQQWGERFEEAFLPENSKIDEYVSFDLNNIKLLNSITYQALYSALPLPLPSCQARFPRVFLLRCGHA